MPRLRRSRLDLPGWTRHRVRGEWQYRDERDRRIVDTTELERIGALAIPPAWQDVWISPHVNDHIQAVGTDAAGRRQYLYHSQWLVRRAKTKHDHVLEIAALLPAARRRNQRALAEAPDSKAAVSALAFRLLDRGMFRVGSERYAKEHHTYGLATLERRHVAIDGDLMVFDYDAKSHQRRSIELRDRIAAERLGVLLDREGADDRLLVWREGSTWHDLTSSEINAYLKQLFDSEISAKDFRTWRATVLAAVAFANVAPGLSRAGRARHVSACIHEVAALLGNTPAVCRASYIDHRVIDLFEAGHTIADYSLRLPALTVPPRLPSVSSRVEAAVLELLA